jgi:hypothetical protein
MSSKIQGRSLFPLPPPFTRTIYLRLLRWAVISRTQIPVLINKTLQKITAIVLLIIFFISTVMRFLSDKSGWVFAFFFGLALGMVQLDEFLSGLIGFIVATFILMVNALTWKGFAGHPWWTKIVRSLGLLGSLLFGLILCWGTVQHKGDKPWSWAAATYLILPPPPRSIQSHIFPPEGWADRPSPPPSLTPNPTRAAPIPIKELATFQASFFTVNPDDFPILEAKLPIVKGTVTLEVTVKNTSEFIAKNGEIMLRICKECSFAKEPDGFQRLPGQPEYARNKPFERVFRGTLHPKMTIDVVPPAGARDFYIALQAYCETCDKNDYQKLHVVVFKQVLPTIEEH